MLKKLLTIDESANMIVISPRVVILHFICVDILRDFWQMYPAKKSERNFYFFKHLVKEKETIS